jgi:multiple sugar transport system substrate-binding protein
MFRRAPHLAVAGLLLVTAACGGDDSSSDSTTADASTITDAATTAPTSAPSDAVPSDSTETIETVAAPITTVATDECDADGITIETANNAVGQESAEAAAAVLEAKYPGLKVEIGTSAAQSYDELTQQVVADIAGGRDIDVVMSGNNQLRFYVDTYQPLPLDVSKLRPTYDRSFLPIGTVDGKAYMAPFQVSVPVLFYNKTLMAEAGLDPEAPPTNYTELFAAARAMQDVSDAGALHVITEGAADWITQAAVQSAGGTYITDDGQPAFDSPEGLKALELYSIAGAEGLQDPVGNAEATAAFNTGATGLYITSSAGTAGLATAIGDAFEWGVELMPVVDGGSPLFPAGGNGWLILTDDPCEAAFASELISEMLAPENLEKSLRVSSYVPVDTEARATLLADPEIPAQQKEVYGYDVELTRWGGWPGDSAPQANKIVTDLTRQLIDGQDPASAIADAQQAVAEVVSG